MFRVLSIHIQYSKHVAYAIYSVLTQTVVVNNEWILLLKEQWMNERKKVYAIKLTNLKNDKISTLINTTNLNLINFHFRKLISSQVDLKTCDYMADIDEEEEGVIETVGISKEIYIKTIRRFKNLRKDKLI